MPQVSGAPKELNAILEAEYSSALNKYKNKAKASKIAWAAVKNAGWSKNKDGKWMKKKTEMSEIEIDSFIAGKYPQGTFGEKELSEIANTYDPKVYEAPILIGHASDYKGQSQIPAFGWIGAVRKVGDHLKLIVSQFSDQLKQWYKEGFYKKVSAAFYQPEDPNNPTPGKWHLHHLAFLGGTPPAVKGLEGIAFCELTLAGVEMAEMQTTVTEGGNEIDTVEEVGTEDTVKDITESCANFIKKIEDNLNADLDEDTKRSRISLAIYDLQSELSTTMNMHYMFIDKLENIEEHKETELSEKKGILVKFAEIITGKKRKEQEQVDAQKEKEYQKTINELNVKVKEFTDAKAVEDVAKAQTEANRLAAVKTAQDEAKKTEIKSFCDTKITEGKMTPAMREKDEQIMITLTGDVLKSFQEKYINVIVPLGETKELNTQQEKPITDKLARAEKYVKDHPAEFADLNPKQALRKVLLSNKI